MSALAIAQARYDSATPHNYPAPDGPIERILQSHANFQPNPETVEHGLDSLSPSEWDDLYEGLAEFMALGESGPTATEMAMSIAQGLAKVVHTRWRKEAEGMHYEATIEGYIA